MCPNQPANKGKRANRREGERKRRHWRENIGDKIKEERQQKI